MVNNKKNILLLTSLYPCDDIKILNNTSVYHYFARKWVKMGYNVRVVFNYNLYPAIFYPLLRLFRKKLANVFGISIQDAFIKKLAAGQKCPHARQSEWNERMRWMG